MGVILKLDHITKLYPGVRALNDVSFSIEEGEVHAIMGENGAGKSTMIKSIGGAISPTSGTITIGDKTFSSLTPATSAENGIGVIYQEFNLVPSLSVAENVCLGNKLGHKFFKSKSQMNEETTKILKSLGLDIDPETMVSALSTGQQQMVEIAKSMIKNVKVLIMDEPTASLSKGETENLLEMVETLKQKGITILYISHRLEEVFRISDRITILRDGTYIGTRYTKDTTRKDLIKMMVGRDIGDEYPKRDTKPSDEVVLEVRNLCGQGDENVSFQLHRGEVLGVAGLVGAGRSEMAKMIFGYLKKDSGEIYIHGKKTDVKSTKEAIQNGIGLVPEDRKREGIFLEYPIEWNIPIMSIHKLCNGIFLDNKRIKDTVDHYIDSLSIATPNPQQLVRNLSGGNQQKVAVAKTLGTNADILIMDEPTRGIDVGAKQEIYNLINSLVAQGKSILMISSEMEEIMGMSDRIMVFYEGEVTGFVDAKDFDQNRIMSLASGIQEA
ncbi:MAG: sugar ABC transporter ATP-binding protein [Solobacterium sp.]|nr:sugar ABC transporter ATP-binding protein [Solobacterium sp.]